MKTWQWLCVVMINGWLMVGGLLAGEAITDNGAVIIEALKAKNIAKDFFKKNPDAKLIEWTLVADHYPEIYPEAATTFAQALICLRDLNNGKDVKVQVFAPNDELWKAGRTVPATPEKQVEYERLTSEFATTEATLSQQLRDSGVKEIMLGKSLSPLIAEKKLEFYQQLFILDAWEVNERELTKIWEVEALKTYMQNLSEQYEIDMTEHNAIFAKLIARYGDWQTPAEICESVNTFLRTRGYPHRKIKFVEGALPAKVLIDELARNYPVIVQLKITNHEPLYLCLLGYTGEVPNIESVFMAFTTNAERGEYIIDVDKRRTKYIRQFEWNDLTEKVSGYFIFNRKTNKE